MVATSSPSSVVCRARLAQGRPVFSSTGSPSRSVRTMTVGPSPFSITATTP